MGMGTYTDIIIHELLAIDLLVFRSCGHILLTSRSVTKCVLLLQCDTHSHYVLSREIKLAVDVVS